MSTFETKFEIGDKFYLIRFGSDVMEVTVECIYIYADDIFYGTYYGRFKEEEIYRTFEEAAKVVIREHGKGS